MLTASFLKVCGGEGARELQFCAASRSGAACRRGAAADARRRLLKTRAPAPPPPPSPSSSALCSHSLSPIPRLILLYSLYLANSARALRNKTAGGQQHTLAPRTKPAMQLHANSTRAAVRPARWYVPALAQLPAAFSRSRAAQAARTASSISQLQKTSSSSTRTISPHERHNSNRRVVRVSAIKDGEKLPDGRKLRVAIIGVGPRCVCPWCLGGSAAAALSSLAPSSSAQERARSGPCADLARLLAPRRRSGS